MVVSGTLSRLPRCVEVVKVTSFAPRSERWLGLRVKVRVKVRLGFVLGFVLGLG